MCIRDSSESELDNFIKNTLSPIPKLTFSKYLDSLRISKKIKKSELIANADIHRNYGYQIPVSYTHLLTIK